MKKFLCLVLALILAMSLFVGCNKTEETTKPKTEEASKTENNEATPENGESSEQETSETSGEISGEATNTEVVTTENAPTVYVADSKDGSLNIYYHLDGCGLLSGTSFQELPWEVVKSLGFRQCPECNPPRYEGYVE